MVYKYQLFRIRMHSDNRRLILDSEVNHSMSEVLLDSKPLTDTTGR